MSLDCFVGWHPVLQDAVPAGGTGASRLLVLHPHHPPEDMGCK